MKEIVEFFAGLKMTVISGVFLLISFVLWFSNIHIFFNPVWLTILISGLPIVYKALNKLIYNHFISSPLLITIAMIASIAIDELLAAGEVAFIMAIGELLEDMTIDKAQKGLGRLLSLTPTTARLVLKNKIKENMPLTTIKKGNILRILPGETIPTDGVIIQGCSSINQATLTGESLPVDKQAGDEVMAGTINCFGTIDIKVTAVEDTYLKRMINLVKIAQQKKAPSQKIIDKWASVLVPSALVLALLVYLFTGNITRGVTILVVFCPCALVLATPTSIMAAISHAAKNGVLIKSGAALEEMGKINTIVFDKTGTLTAGKIKVSDIITEKNISTKKLLTLAASLEQFSEHSLAKSILEEAEAKKISLETVNHFQMFPGKGVRGTTDAGEILVGNQNFIEEHDIILSNALLLQAEKLQKTGKAMVFVACNQSAIGIIALSDEPRYDIKNIIKKIQSLGINVAILTGDNAFAAKYFAELAGIRKIYAQLLPENKVQKIEEMKKSGQFVAMVGDGVNDAPALKTANVGVAMGKIGSDIAIDSADIALINDNINSIPYLKQLSIVTIKTIQTNISISIILNLIGILLSIIGMLNPITGAIFHNIGSVIVVLNAARIYDNKQLNVM